MWQRGRHSSHTPISSFFFSSSSLYPSSSLALCLSRIFPKNKNGTSSRIEKSEKGPKNSREKPSTCGRRWVSKFCDCLPFFLAPKVFLTFSFFSHFPSLCSRLEHF